MTLYDGGIEDDIGCEVAPGWVNTIDEIVLPGALEVLELLLTSNGLFDVGEDLKVDELGAVVFMGKHGARAFDMLIDAALETIGNTDVENAVGNVGHEIDVAFGAHNQSLGNYQRFLLIWIERRVFNSKLASTYIR